MFVNSFSKIKGEDFSAKPLPVHLGFYRIFISSSALGSSGIYTEQKYSPCSNVRMVPAKPPIVQNELSGIPVPWAFT